MIIDTHAHLTSEQAYPLLNEIIDRALTCDVKKIVNICTDEVSLTRGLSLKEKYPFIYHTASTTPHDVEKEGESFFPLVEKAAFEKQLVAIGETGLDYFYKHSPVDLQKKFLEKYLSLALKTDLPVIFHCRDAFEDLFAITAAIYKGKKAIVHCFTGTVDEARKALDRGWLISLSGIVTFKKSVSLREVARFTPLDRLLIETDTPYLAPESRRGKQNEPSFIVETARCLSEVKGVSYQELCEKTAKNAEAFFSF